MQEPRDDARDKGATSKGETAVHVNDVNVAELQACARRIHEILCAMNLVRAPHMLGSFKGWTADGRPVLHRFKVEGYVREGPQVERERAQRESGGA